MEKLNDKVAIVTGGSSGIGEATVRLFAKEGAKVVIADVSESGKELSEELSKEGHKTFFVKTDVTQEEDVINLIDQTVDKFGKLDIMYANAGIAADNPAADLSYDDWKKTIDVNLSGVFLSDKYAVKQFKKQDSKGVIVNAGSIHSFVSLPQTTAYASAKGGVKLLTQNLCTAYAKDGIRVNAVCPGYVATNLLKDVDEDKRKTLEGLHPQGRLGKPEEVAKAVLFLASDDSTFVNGTTLLVDGGYTAQ
ncbi:NAD(P)-dependent dehydrogenase (short-subunit alcohol dehydrogenase family) [Staphylococcus auricularis]|uniref:Diacetyl reductase [(S)-acetoin forming] n=1 Tax=Staphylococcus auricularis TaxID=29379 RepID=A0AAW7MCA4_9STAP|nr:glucose 1-dehydrogenase [Staphylococcus auricularis]MBM0868217.1 SDR family oxidoreductase [Staphylococcus auricularis]MCG7341737.1 glucose 1-dehydrogenase [Staphylococcus auricularis]MDC6327038.1 glucose 1-dehydrogenase [Staphylococcus auricularis]MDN4532915.1 glucose 1-dehydrogenase [Staphylococcus auricularis]